MGHYFLDTQYVLIYDINQVDKKPFAEVDEYGRSTATETHQRAAAQKEKNNQLKHAFGISD